MSKKLELKVAGNLPATAFFSEDSKYYTVSISHMAEFRLTNVTIKWKTKRGTWQTQSFKSPIIKQPKDLYCVYTIELSSWRFGNQYFEFALGLPPVTNFKYEVLNGRK